MSSSSGSKSNNKIQYKFAALPLSVLQDGNISNEAKLLLAHLISFDMDGKGYVWPDAKTLKELMGFKRANTISDITKELEKSGKIIVQRRSQKSNLYIFIFSEDDLSPDYRCTDNHDYRCTDTEIDKGEIDKESDSRKTSTNKPTNPSVEKPLDILTNPSEEKPISASSVSKEPLASVKDKTSSESPVCIKNSKSGVKIIPDSNITSSNLYPQSQFEEKGITTEGKEEKIKCRANLPIEKEVEVASAKFEKIWAKPAKKKVTKEVEVTSRQKQNHEGILNKREKMTPEEIHEMAQREKERRNRNSITLNLIEVARETYRGSKIYAGTAGTWDTKNFTKLADQSIKFFKANGKAYGLKSPKEVILHVIAYVESWDRELDNPTSLLASDKMFNELLPMYFEKPATPSKKEYTKKEVINEHVNLVELMKLKCERRELPYNLDDLKIASRYIVEAFKKYKIKFRWEEEADVISTVFEVLDKWSGDAKGTYLLKSPKMYNEWILQKAGS